MADVDVDAVLRAMRACGDVQRLSRSKRKRAAAAPPKPLRSACVFVVPAGPTLSRRRAGVLRDVAKRLGAAVASLGTERAVTHWVADAELTDERLRAAAGGAAPPSWVQVMTPAWLASLAGRASAEQRWSQQEKWHRVCRPPAKPEPAPEPEPEPEPESESESEHEPGLFSGGFGVRRASDRGIVREQREHLPMAEILRRHPHVVAPPRSRARLKFACQQPAPASSTESESELNARVWRPLQEMAKLAPLFEKGGAGDKRAAQYRAAAAAVRRLAQPLTDADAQLPALTPHMRRRVQQAMDTGSLPQLDTWLSFPETRAYAELCQVWGVGMATARRLVRAGVTTAAAARSPRALAMLQPAQRVGALLHDDLQQRIPRAEVEAIGARVAAALPSGVHVRWEVCGSFRRGAESSGDVDVLLCGLPGGLGPLLDALGSAGFLTHELTDRRGSPDSCMGVCRLPGGLHRRIDLKVCAPEEWAFYTLYFTGSDHFNRSMRAWAVRAGWQLSQHGLQAVQRDPRSRDKTWVGPSVACKTEEEIFEALGLDWVGVGSRSV